MNIAQYKNKVVSAGFDEETTRVLLGLEFQIHGDQAYVDSLQIADRLGIGHNDLLKVIRKFIEEEVELDLGNISHISNQPIIGVIESTYTDTQNRKQVLYLLNEINTLIIIMNIAQYKNKVVSAGFDEETTRVLLGLEFQIHGDQAYVDSLQIAELLGIEHYDLLKIIRKFVDDQDKLGNGKFSVSSNSIIETTYVTAQNKKQPLYLLNERAALRIIMKSHSKNADRIQDIIAEGFLLLRDLHTQQTQVFNPREESVKIIKSELDVYALLEVPLHLAQIESIKTAKAITGIDHSDKLKLAPAQDNIKPEEMMLEPQSLETRLGIGKQGSKVNKVLMVFGYQTKINDVWTPSDKALGKYELHSFTKNGKSGYNYKWNYEFVKKLVDQLITNYGNVDAALKELIK